MAKRPGLALIVNSGCNRPGHEADTDKLVRIFRHLGLDLRVCPKRSCKGPSKDEVVEFLDLHARALSEDPATWRSVWLVFLAHGAKDRLCFPGGDLGVMDLFRKFNLPQLQQRLKVGLVHCCRVQESASADTSPMPSTNDRPSGANWLLYWSTLAGSKASRFASGTPMVSAMIDKFLPPAQSRNPEAVAEPENEVFRRPLHDVFFDVQELQRRLEPTQEPVIATTLNRPEMRLLDLFEERRMCFCIDLGTSGTALCASSDVAGLEHVPCHSDRTKQGPDVLVLEFDDVAGPGRASRSRLTDAGFVLVESMPRVYAVLIHAHAQDHRPPASPAITGVHLFRNLKQQLNEVAIARSKLPIRDDAGLQFDTELLLMLFFSYLKEQWINMHRQRFLPWDVRVAMTVPAHWGLRVQQLLRRSARKAGLFASDEDFLLVMEPEAAAVGCILPSRGRPEQHTKIIVADIGAGTSNVAVVEVTTAAGEDISLKVVAAPRATNLGANSIIKQLVDMLQDVFHRELDDEFPDILARAWDELLVRDAPLHRTYAVGVQIPIPLSCLGPISLPSFRDGVSYYVYEGWGHIELEAQVTQALCQSLIATVCATVQDLKTKYPTASSVVLVGGFARQVSLQNAIRSLGLYVVTPPQPELAVCSGGAHIGRCPSRISSRITSISYGLQKTKTRDLEQYPPHRRVRLPNGKEAVHKVFECLRAKGQEAEHGQEVQRSFWPLQKDQDELLVQIFGTPRDEATFTDDPGMERIGCIRVDLRDLQERDKAVDIVFKFRGNWIDVTATRHDGRALATEVEFFAVGDAHEVIDGDAARTATLL
eukprot:TRINITY_DN58555_c0_g1_i5.p1 TRINITY_DN58555_c0_g1~~TRINITY_DN58555_c0_g1_i5.p1  ORF type:complete len:821 (+),score=84.08 TRINITY_DN58555_c0_g1_i5:50-2512(+)